MKQFDINAVQPGSVVCTSGGKKVRILATDRVDTKYPIVALINMGKYEATRTYSKEGKVFSPEGKNEGSLDLVMPSTPYKGWVNIYSRETEKGPKRNVSPIYASEEQARSLAINTATGRYITTVPIEWEE